MAMKGGEMTHEPLSEAELAELERVFAAGTQGEWVAGYVSGRCTLDHGKGVGGHGGADCVYVAELAEDDASISTSKFPPVLKRGASPRERGVISGTWDYEEGGIGSKGDRDAIVALHNAFPRLMATIRQGLAAQQQIADGEKAVAEFLESRTEAASRRFDQAIDHIQVAVMAERERCAKIAEAQGQCSSQDNGIDWRFRGTSKWVCDMVAKTIRSGE